MVRAPNRTCMCTSEHVITGLKFGKRVCFLTSSSNKIVLLFLIVSHLNAVQYDNTLFSFTLFSCLK